MHISKRSCCCSTWVHRSLGACQINGVPLRRVNQAFIIGMSTNVDISGVNVDKFDGKYFAKEVEKKKTKGESEFFEAEKEEKTVIPAKRKDRKDDQKAVDEPLVKLLKWF